MICGITSDATCTRHSSSTLQRCIFLACSWVWRITYTNKHAICTLSGCPHKCFKFIFNFECNECVLVQTANSCILNVFWLLQDLSAPSAVDSKFFRLCVSTLCVFLGFHLIVFRMYFSAYFLNDHTVLFVGFAVNVHGAVHLSNCSSSVVK